MGTGRFRFFALQFVLVIFTVSESFTSMDIFYSPVYVGTSFVARNP